MPTHVALLRGINLGSRNRVAMADLRAIVASLGHGEVDTYVQSGNVVFASGRDAGTTELAEQLEQAIGRALGFAPHVVVLSRAQLEQVVRRNPFPDEGNPKWLHGVFRADPFPPAQAEALLTALEQARQRGSTEDARIIGRCLYLHTPGGLAGSELAASLARPAAGATARNWATVTALMRLLGVPGEDGAVR